MFFVKSCRFLTACAALCLLTACVSSRSITDFNRNEAVKARINLALAYLGEQDFAKAKENIDRAMAHDNQDYLPYSVLGYYYQQLRDPIAAEKSYQQALALSRKQSVNHQPLPDVLNNYGTFLCEQGKFEAALSQFEKVLTNPARYYHQADTLENMALCAKQSGAAGTFERAVQALQAIEPHRAAWFSQTVQ